MRDLILSILILSLLVWAFSFAPSEDKPQSDTVMYLPIVGESPTEVTPTPTERNEMPMPSLETEKQSIENNPSDKRPETSEPEAPQPTKTIDELAWEVIIGLWDCTDERKRLLTEAGYNYEMVQSRVNEILEQQRRKANDYKAKAMPFGVSGILLPGKQRNSKQCGRHLGGQDTGGDKKISG